MIWRAALATALYATVFPVQGMAQIRAPSVSTTLPARIGNDDIVRYTVHKGDTLYTLARHYMHRHDDWRAVRLINRVPNPYKLVPGSTLLIPAKLLKPLPLTARIASFRGDGRIEQTKGPDLPLTVNQAIVPGMTVETGAHGMATILLSNGSRLTLPSQTRVRAVTLRRFLLNGMVDVNFLLEKGRLETSATPIGGTGGQYRIHTPIAVSAVRGTVFRVGYAGDGAPSLTEVVEGAVAVGRVEGNGDIKAGIKTDGEMTTIASAYGAAISARGEIMTAALLPPPRLIAPGKVQVDPQVVLAMEPVHDATGYHVQIARDAGFVEMEQEQQSATPLVRFDGIEDGRWFVRISALADNGLEGMPQTYTMRRVRIGLSASSEQNADGGYRFRWVAEGGGTHVYHFRLRPDDGDAPSSSSGTSVPAMVDETGLTGDQISLSDLPSGKYKWSVGVQHYENGEGTTMWLPEQTLIVGDDGDKKRDTPRARAK